MISQQSFNIDSSQKEESIMSENLQSTSVSDQKIGSKQISYEGIQNETCIQVEEERKEEDNYIEEDDNDKQVVMKQCDVQQISFMTKSPHGETIFLMFGDLLIETRDIFDDIDYTVELCNVMLNKKSVSQVEYNKVNQVIEVKFNNKQPGFKNFQYVKQLLLSSQDMSNYTIAQLIDSYEKNTQEVEINYMRFFCENDYNLVHQSQQEYIAEATSDFVQSMLSQNIDFYQYVVFSYIDDHELGHPVQIQQGMSESSCALVGLDRDQMIEIVSRFGFLEKILMRGFYREMFVNETYNQIYLMHHVDTVTKIPNLFDNYVTMSTADGIKFRIKLRVTQSAQEYNGLTITTMYKSEFHIDPEEIKRIILVRESQANMFSPQNVVDIILQKDSYIQNAEKFATYLYNPYNFRPKSKQDHFPDKTCKYKSINPEKSQNL